MTQLKSHNINNFRSSGVTMCHHQEFNHFKCCELIGAGKIVAVEQVLQWTYAQCVALYLSAVKLAILIHTM